MTRFPSPMRSLAFAVLIAGVCSPPPHGAAARDAQALPAIKLPSVSVTPVETSEIAETAIVSGTLVPKLEVLVPAEIDGYAIVELLADEGDTVREGQVLARLNRSTLEAQLAQNVAQLARNTALLSQAKAQIQEAEANLTEASRSLERTKTLRESGTATVEKLDQRTAAATSATSRLASAREALAVTEADRKNIEAQRQELDIRLARTEIRAPRAGIISRRTARVGQIASMAADPLFRIIADGLVELEAEVADVRLPRVLVGQKVLVTPAGYSDSLEGKIRLVSPEVDKASRLGRIRVSISSPTPLSIGASAKGIIELGRKLGPTVPQSAVSFSKDGASVQVVVDGIVKSRAVTLGLSGATRFQVVAGLREGELVVVRAGSFLRDGDRVTAVVEEKKP